MNIVKYNWVERGGKGFVEVNFFYGESDEPDYAQFYFDHAQAMSLVVSMGKALETGLGEPGEKLMEREIALHFSGTDIILDRPCTCRLIARDKEEVQIVSGTGQRAFLWCASAAASERVVKMLHDNSLTDLRLGDGIVKMIFHSCDEIFAAGLSADEIVEMDRDHERVDSDCWLKRCR